ncbi:hypothetical protein FSARC_7747 [Fusarium sarcochroum]|uniref:Homeobox domain-containing protein n=1 Tax=Fusarium sarcochroum TaxID=1208366 RepID=A0A8H4TUK8_9HYPO|nr:hypothetical protein FSARC_7747 [Fusarium sarcochroum]
MSLNSNEFLEHLDNSLDSVNQELFSLYSTSGQEPDSFTLDFLQDPNHSFNIDQGRTSPLQSQPPPDQALNQLPFGNHLSFTAESSAAIPVCQHGGSLPDTHQPSPASVASRVTPPKIGSRFSREAVHILRGWLTSNTERPFPNDEEKEMLCFRTGLTRTQILNWLANARRRSKLFARPLDLPQQTQPTQALDIPERQDTPALGESFSLMTPLERWVESPPEHEPAAPTAIAHAVARSSNPFPETFKTKHIWQRHEKSLHLPIETWECSPHGPRITNTAGVLCCAFCAKLSPDDAHIESHNFLACLQRPPHDRTFSRKDHLSQHLRLVHNTSTERLGCPLHQWRLPEPEIRSRCGFCGKRMETWAARIDHLADHFKLGSTMADWAGDWGFDPSILFRVQHAIPPYIIATDRNTLCPFEASKGPSETPENAFDLIKLELVHFVHVHSDKFGNIPTADEIHFEACRILLSAEVVSDWQGTNTSWLRDLISSDNNILRQAQEGPVRATTAGKLKRLRVPGKDQLFDSCPLEIQLRDWANSSPAHSLADCDLQQEAARLIQDSEAQPELTVQYVLDSFVQLIRSSTEWLAPFRERHKLDHPTAKPFPVCNRTSQIDEIIQNYNSLEEALGNYVELLRAHHITPDDEALRRQASNIINEFHGPEWKAIALHNKAWFETFKKRHLLNCKSPQSAAVDSSDPTPPEHTFLDNGLQLSPRLTNTNSGYWSTKSSFMLNGDCYHRWIARELARWVTVTMSPNNPNQHIPTDQEIQYHARLIVFDEYVEP